MWFFLITGLFLLVSIGCFVGSFYVKRQIKGLDLNDRGDRRRIENGEKSIQLLRIASGVAILLAAVYSLVRAVVIVDVGHSAVSTFAGDTRSGLDNGVHFILPWYDVVDYETRVQEYTMSGDGSGDDIEAAAISAPTKDGSSVKLDMTVRYQIDSGSTPEIYRQYGSGSSFEEKVIYNDLRAVARDVIVRYDALEARIHREEIGPIIADILQARWGDLARVELVNVRDIALDPAVQEAANNVLRAEEAAREREFTLQEEETNANIERIRAKGVADSQQIIICGGTVTVDDDGNETVIPNEGDSCEEQLSDELLVWKYIETLEKIGNSGNMVIVTSGDAKTDLMLQTPKAE